MHLANTHLRTPCRRCACRDAISSNAPLSGVLPEPQGQVVEEREGCGAHTAGARVHQSGSLPQADALDASPTSDELGCAHSTRDARNRPSSVAAHLEETCPGARADGYRRGARFVAVPRNRIPLAWLAVLLGPERHVPGDP